MSEAEKPRDGIAVITGLYELTREMTRRKDDADFLVASVAKRQELMDEYDRLQKDEDPGEQDVAEMTRMVEAVMEMDVEITAALEEHKKGVKTELAASANQQKVLGYVNQALSSSGSYMDYKK